ncbi:MAG: hypothetical protein HYV26_20200 [Candidatus Hydrogenedentes bacterium]|nr:hypothetical protein [Candidatus Hydrogenedentota bacterium]MBI3118398.1 hypothetical protein [Candidatus Hydrogenedentota bacterium]
MRILMMFALGLGACLEGCPWPPLAPCPERTGGALISFEVAGDEIDLWITNDAFIDTAIGLLGEGPSRVPNFLEIVAGTDCDERWSWHVDPQQVEWADFTIELCDGTPSYIEAHRDAWIQDVGQWCPWSAAVMSVDDRR